MFKIKGKLVRCCSILALSLGFFITSPTIILSDAPRPIVHKAVYSDEKPRWEYSTHGWYFTLKEMKEIYEKEYEEGTRLENHIKKEGNKYIAFEHGESCEIPEKFVKSTLNQFEQMLEKGYAKYIFRLDAFHSHFFIPNEVFHKYKDLKGAELTAAYTQDDKLGALYHNSEHLALRDKDGNIDPEAKGLISKRSVLGWYDGRSLEITHPKEDAHEKIKEANSAGIPDGYQTIGNIHFKATKNGEFSVKHNGKEIRVDISFDAFDYY